MADLHTIRSSLIITYRGIPPCKGDICSLFTYQWRLWPRPALIDLELHVRLG